MECRFTNESVGLTLVGVFLTNDLLYQLSYGGGNSNYVYSSKGENLNAITLLGKLL